MPEPRVGFAYDVLGDGKMALRAGIGLFNERLRQNNFNFGAGAQWPNLISGSSTTATSPTSIPADVGDPRHRSRLPG